VISMDRRRFLGQAGRAALACGVALAAGPALAFRIEDDAPPSDPRVRALVGRCEIQSEHERMIAELVAELEGRESRAAALAEVQAMRCPLCGCPLAASLPADSPPARF